MLEFSVGADQKSASGDPELVGAKGRLRTRARVPEVQTMTQVRLKRIPEGVSRMREG